MSWGDFIADVGSSVFHKDPVRPDQRKLLRATFKTEITEQSSKLTVLTVIFGPKLYSSDLGSAVRSWLWEHSIGVLKRWFHWPWWGSSASSSEPAPAAAEKKARPAREAVIDVQAETDEPETPAPEEKPAPAAAQPAQARKPDEPITVTAEEIAQI